MVSTSIFPHSSGGFAGLLINFSILNGRGPHNRAWLLMKMTNPRGAVVMEKREKIDILQLFEEKDVVYFCAPMVRYSKLPFRKLVRKYGSHIACTPMIMSESFVRSQKARDVEFTTDSTDSPLIVQFAANNTEYFSRAATLVAPYADGVDLNCGCPQRWALQECYGAYLINHPQLVSDMVLSVKRTCEIPVSIKIRIQDDLRLSNYIY